MRGLLWLSSLAIVLAAGCGGSSSGDGGGGNGNGGGGNGGPPTAGLDARPSNTTCLAPPRDPGSGGALDVELEEAFPDLPNLTRPVAMRQPPGDTSRWYVVEQPGVVRAFDNDADASSFTEVIDIEGRVDDDPNEAGLLGLAFHPDFASNGHVYLSYTAPGNALVSHVSRFTSNDGGATLDPGSEDDVLVVNQDFGNHNGGHIAFGPDDNLFIGLGDGGSGGDPNGRAQDTTNLLGAMLRIDVDGGDPYGIPSDNEWADNALCPADHSSDANCPEIYAWGLRNPWRWSFDSATQELWVGDVGQGEWEEIDVVELGGNYGWDCREGAHAYTGPPDGSDAACPAPENLIDPVHEYDHSNGVSITGGYVYRGDAIPALEGRYVFADFATSTIWALEADGQGGYTREQIAQSPQGVSSFAEGPDGELYVLGWGQGGEDGRIRKLVPGDAAEPQPEPVAASLSETGCVAADDPAEPAAGLIPYAPVAAFWSDNATKERWLALPDGTSMSIGADGDFALPEQSVLVKHFRLGDRLVETRLFMHHPDGTWAGYSYEWNEAQTDATLLTDGKVASVDDQDWIFPSRDQCLQCHTGAAGFSLGLETAQLNHDIAYSRTDRTANQLATLDAIALFDAPLGDPAARPALADPYDAAAPTAERARAYLHTNCAQCHRFGGAAPGSMDLRYDVALGDMNVCDVEPQSGDAGLGADARLVDPGMPDTSVLLERMNHRDAGMMPPLATNIVDADGADVIRDWIAGLDGCQDSAP